jgi:hypothetical protein
MIQPFDLEQAPLDRPQSFGKDWGGDGSELDRPVRAHVLEALLPTSAPYPPPVAALIALGDVRVLNPAARYDRCGPEHLADLVRMARDRALFTAPDDSVKVWAPAHALYVLADLDCTPVLADLVPLFDVRDDWFADSFELIFARAGEPALPPLSGYLCDPGRWAYGHAKANDALVALVRAHPRLRLQALDILDFILRHAEWFHPLSCTYAIMSLVSLRAVESLPAIRHAFALGRVNEMAGYTWEGVLRALSLRSDPGDPLVAESQRRFDAQRDHPRLAALRARVQDLVGQQQPPQPERPAASQRGERDRRTKKAHKSKRKA